MLETMRKMSGELAKPSFMDKIFTQLQENPRKIVTSNVCPPIPARGSDWCAYYDGEEEDGNYGYGETEQDAIRDLLETYPDPMSLED